MKIRSNTVTVPAQFSPGAYRALEAAGKRHGVQAHVFVERLVVAVLQGGNAAHREVEAQALDDFSLILDERYPADVFLPLNAADNRAVNAALDTHTGPKPIVRDRVSADMMRRAAAQARREAAEIREGWL